MVCQEINIEGVASITLNMSSKEDNDDGNNDNKDSLSCAKWNKNFLSVGDVCWSISDSPCIK